MMFSVCTKPGQNCKCCKGQKYDGKACQGKQKHVHTYCQKISNAFAKLDVFQMDACQDTEGHVLGLKISLMSLFLFKFSLMPPFFQLIYPKCN